MAATSYLPANETYLALGQWLNASLWSQHHPFSNAIQDEAYRNYMANMGDTNVNLTILPNSMASLTFNAADNWTSLVFPISEMLFDSAAYRSLVVCSYPISGSYGLLNRALFYVLMVFSLVFRRHQWLSVAALGTAMTYAATAAVHALALESHFTGDGLANKPGNSTSTINYTDPDIYGIAPILIISAVMLTPILMWSTTVKKLQAQALVLCWGVLVFASLGTILHQILQPLQGKGGATDQLLSFASCTSNSSWCMSNLPDARLFPYGLPRDFYNSCDCVDFCGTLSPTTPMRKGASMVANLPDYNWLEIQSEGFYRLEWGTFVLTLYIFLNGILSIFISQMSPEDLRNRIFKYSFGGRELWARKLTGDYGEERLITAPEPSTNVVMKPRHKSQSGLWFSLSKLMASGFFLGALLVAILSPVAFIVAIVILESYLYLFPVSEYHDAVGAWGPWVSTAFVLIASIIERYHHTWINFNLTILGSLWRYMTWSKTDRQELRRRKHQKSLLTRENPPPGTTSNASSYVDDDSTTKLKRMTINFCRIVVSPLVHSYYSILRSIWGAKMTIHIFILWWKDPEEMSELDRSQSENKVLTGHASTHVARRQTDSRDLPICRCQVCENKASEAKNENEKKAARTVLERFAAQRRARREVQNSTPIASGRRRSDSQHTHDSSEGLEMYTIPTTSAGNASKLPNVTTSPADIPLPPARFDTGLDAN